MRTVRGLLNFAMGLVLGFTAGAPHAFAESHWQREFVLKTPHLIDRRGHIIPAPAALQRRAGDWVATLPAGTVLEVNDDDYHNVGEKLACDGREVEPHARRIKVKSAPGSSKELSAWLSLYRFGMKREDLQNAKERAGKLNFACPSGIESACEKWKEALNSGELDLDPCALANALAWYGGQPPPKTELSPGGVRVQPTRFIVIGDYSKPSTQKRLYLLDTETGLIQKTYVGHGGGSSPDARNPNACRLGRKWTTRFSESVATPRGQWRGGGEGDGLTSPGAHVAGRLKDVFKLNPSRSEREERVPNRVTSHPSGARLLRGLEMRNRHAEERYIELHGDTMKGRGATGRRKSTSTSYLRYVSRDVETIGVGRSSGCSALQEDGVIYDPLSGREVKGIARYIVHTAAEQGTLVYNFTGDPRREGAYCSTLASQSANRPAGASGAAVTPPLPAAATP